ncbi:hypothetical protein JCGZ_00492 [Jatropha curcas]|uniref:Uncharacterized protein n=1 Tax=Jatropha curcas TaxID=180498 RepID=A0A067L6G2_JATCU|nr:hypothetical protein JCGZ_00492 [Jatropha curcas]
MYSWILSTGWWKNRAPVNPDVVIVVGFLCTCLIGGFIYINRVKSLKCTRKQFYQSLKLILIIASLYSSWCASQIYWVNPRTAAVGEEADLGVLLFLATYFFLPHYLCIMSMNTEDHNIEPLPSPDTDAADDTLVTPAGTTGHPAGRESDEEVKLDSAIVKVFDAKKNLGFH